MRRFVLLLALLGLLFGQAVLTVSANGLSCEDECSDDGPLECTGDDGCCTCCFHPRTSLPQAAAVAHLDRTWSDVALVSRPLPFAAPREILHVPKPGLS
jgi:hypothetical protein